MQLTLWYPEEFKAVGVPFYIPIKASVFGGSGNYTYTWEINNHLLSKDVSYEAYSKLNICCLGFLSIGILGVTVIAHDIETNEEVSEYVEIEGRTKDLDGIYRFDEEPVATYYDDRYSPNFAIEWKKKFEAGDKFKGAYNYFIGKFEFYTWDPDFDYSSLENEIKDLVNRTLQPDQMWDRYYNSDCKCQYSISDPVDVYYPNKFVLMHLFTSPDGIGFHIKLKNDYPLFCAVERLFQAISFSCALHGITLKRKDYDMHRSARPLVYYDSILNDLDTHTQERYDEMKTVLDIDYIYELIQSETDNFLGQKSYNNDMYIDYWQPDESYFGGLLGDNC